MILRAVVGRPEAGMRLDDGVKALFPRFSKTRIRNVIDWGACRVGGAVVRVASRPLREGDEVVFAVTDPDPDVGYVLAPGDVLFQDAEYLAVRKPDGVYCQRTPYQLKGTMEFAVDRFFRASGVPEPARVVHRLDRGTSGTMVFPKTRRAAAWLSGALQAERVEKAYWALVCGEPGEAAWSVDAPIAPLGNSRFAVSPRGREARTDFRLLAVGGGAALVEARPRTGRTHQIRLHLAHRGLPVLGDARYGGAAADRLMLHCRSMSFAAEDGRHWSATAPAGDLFLRECARRGISA